jgi:hypothetical protein
MPTASPTNESSTDDNSIPEDESDVTDDVYSELEGLGFSTTQLVVLIVFLGLCMLTACTAIVHAMWIQWQNLPPIKMMQKASEQQPLLKKKFVRIDSERSGGVLGGRLINQPSP